MTYKILSTSQNQETIILTVEYTLDDSTILTTDIQIFAPESIEYINQTIVTRGIFEQNRITISNKNQELLNQIPINQTIDITI